MAADVPEGQRRVVRPPGADTQQQPQPEAQTQTTKTVGASLLQFDWVTIIAVVGLCTLAGVATWWGNDNIALTAIGIVGAWVTRLYK